MMSEQLPASDRETLATERQTDWLAMQPSPKRKTGVPATVIGFALCVLVIFAGIFLFGLLPRMEHEKESIAAQKESTTAPVYPVSVVKSSAKTSELKLPGNVQAIQEFSIFSRCDGYLKTRLVDIGDRVKRGQLLMVVDAPELEKQLMRSSADLKQAQAQVKSAQADLAQSLSVVESNKAAVKRLEAQIHYSVTELARYQELATQGAISAEQRDEKQRDLSTDRALLEAAHAAVAASVAQAAANREKIDATKAAVDAARAGVEEIQTTTAFQRVVAPCDGVITSRSVDAGALVSKGSSTNNAELLKMARTDTLRVFVFIPQSDYQGVYVGMPAKITVAELPNKASDGQIAHISGGLDAASRTLQAEIQIPNRTGQLMPGMFAQVGLIANRKAPPALIPDSSIVVKPDGQFTVTVDAQGKVHYQPVELGRDFGKESEVLSGLTTGQRIMTQPPGDIREGQTIKPSTK